MCCGDSIMNNRNASRGGYHHVVHQDEVKGPSGVEGRLYRLHSADAVVGLDDDCLWNHLLLRLDNANDYLPI